MPSGRGGRGGSIRRSERLAAASGAAHPSLRGAAASLLVSGMWGDPVKDPGGCAPGPWAPAPEVGGLASLLSSAVAVGERRRGGGGEALAPVAALSRDPQHLDPGPAAASPATWGPRSWGQLPHFPASGRPWLALPLRLVPGRRGWGPGTLV